MKNIIKRVLPIPLLRKVFFYYNLFKKNTIDKLLFPEYKVNKEELKFFIEINQYKEYGLDKTQYHDSNLQKGMDYWNSWTQEEYIVEINQQCVIEPEQGWAFVSNKIILFSLGLGKELYVRYPSFLKLYFNRYRKIRLESVISLRDTGENNYFHFYNDILSKLFFLESRGYKLEEYSIIISDSLNRKEYFQKIKNMIPRLSALDWVVQKGNDFIVSEKTLFCKPITHKREIYHHFIKDVNQSVVVEVRGTRKLYITRKKSSLRYIKNEEQLLPILEELGFELVDPSDLSLNDQINLFAQASFICGIHGAGLTNMIYCKKAVVTVLEIFPPMGRVDYLPYHYIMLSKMLEFDYNAIIGESIYNDYSGAFSVNPNTLREKLLELTGKI